MYYIFKIKTETYWNDVESSTLKLNDILETLPHQLPDKEWEVLSDTESKTQDLPEKTIHKKSKLFILIAILIVIGIIKKLPEKTDQWIKTKTEQLIEENKRLNEKRIQAYKEKTIQYIIIEGGKEQERIDDNVIIENLYNLCDNIMNSKNGGQIYGHFTKFRIEQFDLIKTQSNFKKLNTTDLITINNADFLAYYKENYLIKIGDISISIEKIITILKPIFTKDNLMTDDLDLFVKIQNLLLTLFFPENDNSTN